MVSVPRELPFLDSNDIPADFSCGLCTELLNEPILTACCGRNACEECIHNRASLDEDNTCPMCQLPGFSCVRDQKAERQMREMIIYCKNHSKGCLWSGSVREIRDHLQSKGGCSFTIIACPQNCGATMERQHLNEHLKANCYICWTACPHCQDMVPEGTLDSHLDTACLEYPLKCPNDCGDTMKRAEITEHRDHCPKEMIVCPFLSSGCTAKVLRCEIMQHCTDRQQDHLLMSYNSLHKDVDQLKKQLQHSLSEVQAQKTQIEASQKQTLHMQYEVESIKNKTANIASVLSQELEYISEQPHTALVKTLAIDCMKNQLTFLSNPMLLKLYPTGPGLYFRMPMFSVLKTADRPWCSLPFVVQNGYQMCIVVHPNGEGDGRSTHISIYVHLISGQYDDDLVWPLYFNDELVVSLMKQMPEQTKSNRFSRRSNKQSGVDLNYGQQQRLRTLVHILHRVNKPVGELGLAFGYIGLFCTQNSLDDTVLYNDSLVFQLSMTPGRNT